MLYNINSLDFGMNIVGVYFMELTWYRAAGPLGDVCAFANLAGGEESMLLLHLRGAPMNPYLHQMCISHARHLDSFTKLFMF